MSKRMRVATPVVYEVLPEDRTIPEDDWGWMELRQIAEIAGLPAFFILLHFLEFGSAPMKIRGRDTRIFYYQRTPCGVPDKWEIRSPATRDFDHVYEDCRCKGDLQEVGLNRFVETHSARVPARWGFQVLAELKKRPITLPS